MARIATRLKTMKAASNGQKPRRTPGARAEFGATAGPAKAARATLAPKRVTVAPSPAPKVSKDELRAQVDKLDRANATLRAKNREATREAKRAAARIAELEVQLARLEEQLATLTASTGGVETDRKRKTGGARSHDIDPGDAVPPEVAVEEPSPPDLEAELARQNLEKHLRAE
jgi:chromosome segregation ATPase